MRKTSVILVVPMVALFGVIAASAGTLIDAIKAGDAAAVRTLLRQPGAVHMPDVDGTTPLHWAVQRGDVSMVDTLLTAGADVHAVNRYGVPPLTLAATNGDAAII